MYTIDLYLFKFYINRGKLYFSIETFLLLLFLSQ